MDERQKSKLSHKKHHSISKKITAHHIDKKQKQTEFKMSMKVISNLNDRVILDLILDQMYEKAYESLNELEKTIQDANYGMERKLYYYHKSVAKHNRSLVCKQIQLQQESLKSMEDCIVNIQQLLAFLPTRQQTVFYNLQLIREYFKYCVLLSQKSRHEQSIQIIQKCLQKLIDSFRILQAICYENLYQRNSESLTSTKSSTPKREQVDFKQKVIQDAHELLKDLIRLPTPYKLCSEKQIRLHFQQILKKIYFWKNNTANNEKLIRKQLQIQTKSQSRNLLGVQKQASWLKQFNIGSVVCLQHKSMHLDGQFQKYYLLSQPKIKEMVAYGSACYFTMATQTRFRQEVNCQLNKLKIDERYRKINRDENILKCKIMHLKAIQLAGQYLPPGNELMKHLVSSFNINYKSILDQINEQINEYSIKSVISVEGTQFDKQPYRIIDKNNQQQEELVNEYGIQPKKQKKKKRSRRNSTEKTKSMSKPLRSKRSPSFKKNK